MTEDGRRHTARVKIVATIGPASSSPDRIDTLLAAGVSVSRVNCAHGSHDTLTAMIRSLRERTRSGATARHLAKWRPPQPILAVTQRPDTWHRLNLVWGVTPILVDDFGPHVDAACTRILETLSQRHAVASGRRVVLTAGLPFFAARANEHATHRIALIAPKGYRIELS